MMGLLVIVTVVMLVVRWRLAHRARRRSEAKVRQVSQRPFSDFEARFPADRRLRDGALRFSKRRVGF